MNLKKIAVFLIAIGFCACSEPNTVKDKQGHKYQTVTINGVEWMAENLNTKTEDSWCWEDLSNYCDTKGRLYTFEAAMKACPKGWHVPTKADLEKTLSSEGADDQLEHLLFNQPGGSMEKVGKFEHEGSTYLWFNLDGKPAKLHGRLKPENHTEMGQSLRCVR